MAPIPAGVVVILCVFCFLAGLYLQQGAQLPDPGTAQPQQTRRALTMSEESASSFSQTLETETVQAGQRLNLDPLDPTQMETTLLEASGLLDVRPPVPAAQSGDNFYRLIPMQILSWYPRVVVFPGFVDKARCDHVIALATKMMYPSGLAYAPGEKGSSEQQTRTSKGAFMSSEMDPDGVLGWVEERIAAATLLPRENGEAFNVLQYQNMQHYDSHMDSFDPKQFGPQPSQRIATVLIYLSDVDEGGETVFKKEGLNGADRSITDWRNCDDGSFKYKPRRGDAVLFWGVNPDGEIDPHSLHGGCPVKNGTKWVMTKWLRSKGLGARRPPNGPQ
eukprot:gene13954-19889_t